MKKSNVNTKILTVIFSLFVIGGAASVYKLFHTNKNLEQSLDSVKDAQDGFFFI